MSDKKKLRELETSIKQMKKETREIFGDPKPKLNIALIIVLAAAALIIITLLVTILK